MNRLKPIFSTTADVTDKDKSLEGCECDEVLITLPNVLNDDNKTVLPPDSKGNYNTTGNHIFWGTNNATFHQLFVTGEIRIPVKNLNQIWIRGNNPPTGQYISITCFQEK